jgi:two-component system cell cycle sensor histidine kinase/response regulator CckA
LEQNPLRQITDDKSAPLARVLILEDEEMLRELIRISVEMLGCEAGEASNGQSAIQAHRQAIESGARFSLLITDLTLPGTTSAVQALEIMRQLDPCLKAVLCTGNTQSEIYRNFQNHGFSGRIPKPFEVSELFETIRNHLP